MKLTVGTFNLNNLFSRYNFKANINEIKEGNEVSYSFDKDDHFRIRKFKGNLVKPKSHKTSLEIAERLLRINVDILCVQEVEDIGILKKFNKDYLKKNRYPYVVLIEGNDSRLIDVGILSRYPIGAITSWKEARANGDTNGAPVFGRDLLQVDVLNRSRKHKLFTIFNTHLKSNFVPFFEDQVAGAIACNERRRKQSATIAKIIKSVTRPNSRYILTGDMNDVVESEFLEPFTKDTELNLTNALSNPEEIGEMNKTKFPPDTHIWTHRFSPGSGVFEYHLYDHIWISNSLTDNFEKAFIDRRKKVGGNGSDHDPAWIELEL
ncbi:MAG: endonuclease/exonuclease/phosphatase family protein [Bacteroidota bacterium]